MPKDFGLIRAITRPGQAIQWWHVAVGVGLIWVGHKLDYREEVKGDTFRGKSHMFGKPDIRYDSKEY